MMETFWTVTKIVNHAIKVTWNRLKPPGPNFSKPLSNNKLLSMDKSCWATMTHMLNYYVMCSLWLGSRITPAKQEKRLFSTNFLINSFMKMGPSIQTRFFSSTFLFCRFNEPTATILWFYSFVEIYMYIMTVKCI